MVETLTLMYYNEKDLKMTLQGGTSMSYNNDNEFENENLTDNDNLTKIENSPVDENNTSEDTENNWHWVHILSFLTKPCSANGCRHKPQKTVRKQSIPTMCFGEIQLKYPPLINILIRKIYLTMYSMTKIRFLFFRTAKCI